MGCTVMSNINFDNPWLLLIAVPLIVLFTVPFAIAVRKVNRNGHNITSQVLHVLLAIIIAFAAAGTSITTVLTETQVYVVADVSYSANKNLNTIDNIIKQKLILPRNCQVGLITFGKEYELLAELGNKKDLPSVKESTVDDSETNIAEALEYAATLFTDDVIKRVVLITDGKQTDEVDTYAMRRAIDSLQSREIKVDAYYLDDNLNSSTPEVQISGAEYTVSAFINHEEVVTVTVDTNCESRGSMYLYKNGAMFDRRAVTFTEGKNTVTFNLDTKTGGVNDYEVRVDVDNDSSEYNNTYSFTQSVSNELKVLIITNDWNDCKTLVQQYDGSATVDMFEKSDTRKFPHESKRTFLGEYKNNDKINIYNFDTSINAGNVASENVIIKNIPYTVEDLVKYDEIVLADLDVRTLNGIQDKFLDSLEKVVGTYGKSLVTLGNTYIHEDNLDPVLNKLDSMLPVRYGRTDDDPLLYTLVIDQSISMIDVDGIETAKRVAKSVVDMMQDEDQILIVGYWGQNERIYGPKPMTRADEVVAKIDAIEPKQGTSTLGGLTSAYESISRLQYNKQVLLITDGRDGVDPAYAQQVYDLVKSNADKEVVTSVYDVGRGNVQNAATCEAFLRKIVEQCPDGKYYDSSASDFIFDEFSDREVEKVFDRDATVTVNNSTDKVLSGLSTSEINNMPLISGYIKSVPRASATTVLEIAHKKPNGNESNIPLYAHWNFGSGKVASFTSTVTGTWIRYWNQKHLDSGKDLTTTFLDRVLYTNIPAQKTDYPYTFSVIQDGTATHVQITPPSIENMSFEATAKINLTMPDGEVITQELIRDGDHYFYDFSSAAVGRYQVEVVYAYNGAEYAATTVLNVSYASEYDEFALFEASPLFRAINGRGQVVLEGEMRIENDPDEVGTYTNDFTLPLLIFAVALFVVDIVIRKLKWEDVVSFFGGFKKTGGKKS